MPFKWFCVQTKTQKAFSAKAHITRLGYNTLMPVETKIFKYYGVEKQQLVPLFGNYVFTQFDTDFPDWRRIWSQPGVRRIFSTAPNTPTPIPDRTITSLQQCTTTDDDEIQIIKPNCVVRVIAGPLAATEDQLPTTGICSWTRGHKAALLMEIMGGSIEVVFDLDSLELEHAP
jgi:transcription antitermination factor NusG